MSELIPKCAVAIGFAAFEIVLTFYRDELNEEEKRGGPEIEVLDLGDGLIVEVPDYEVRTKAKAELFADLREERLHSYLLADDGRILLILSHFWQSKAAGSDALRHLLLEDMPSIPVSTPQGEVVGRPYLKRLEFNQYIEDRRKGDQPERHQLERIEGSGARGGETGKKPSPQLDKVLKVLRRLFPDGLPEDMPTREIEKRVNPELGRYPPSRLTIRRAAIEFRREKRS